MNNNTCLHSIQQDERDKRNQGYKKKGSTFLSASSATSSSTRASLWALLLAALTLLPASQAWAEPSTAPQTLENTQALPSKVATGKLLRYPNVSSQKLKETRHIDIWLPKQYSQDKSHPLPVLYMHDGQNLFDPSTSTYGVEWQMDETLQKLIDAGDIPPTIVVGLWSTLERFLEYQPNKPIQQMPSADIKSVLTAEYGGAPKADSYLSFLVEEVKPFVDRHYNTRPERESTFIMGSSMGGLISLYALAEYPGVFGGVAAVSTHWPLSLRTNNTEVADALITYYSSALPSPGQHRIYFDYGTETLDALYEPHQHKMDKGMQALGYTEGKDWITLKYEGHEHSEKAWSKRTATPIKMLLGPISKP